MNAHTFLKSALQQFKDYKQMADKTFDQLDNGDFYFVLDKTNNSIAVNITHMHGNMLSRWTNFLTEDGEKAWRKRDEEFEASQLSKAELLQLWEEGWKVLFDSIQSLSLADLEKTIYIRTRALTVIEAIHRQLTHYAYHVGQIVFLGKAIKGDQWETLSIAKGGSNSFNEQLKVPH